MNRYVEEIEDFYLRLKKTSPVLSSKERDLILKWYQNKIPIDIVKELIKQEFFRYPVSKKRKFSLLSVDRKVEEYLRKRGEVEVGTDKENVRVKNRNLNKKEKEEITEIWKNLSVEEKERIKKSVQKQLRNLNLTKEEKKEAIRILIKKIVKDTYLRD